MEFLAPLRQTDILFYSLVGNAENVTSREVYHQAHWLLNVSAFLARDQTALDSESCQY